MAKSRKVSRKTKNKTRKQSGGGKKKLSGYMKFCKETRKSLPSTLEFTEVGKELGKRWRSLSDAEKKRY